MAVTGSSRPPLRTPNHQLSGHGSKRTSVFRPPLTPATPTSDSDRTADSSRQQHSGSRKRPRTSVHTAGGAGQRSTPTLRVPQKQDGYFDRPSSASRAGSWSLVTPNAAYESPAARSAISPPPFVDTRYDLANGLDTPNNVGGDGTRAAESDFGQGREELYRRRWDTESKDEQAHRKRQRPSDPNGAPSYAAGWGSAVYGFIGGVAGRMLEFCKSSTPFKGFSAGGGESYGLVTPVSHAQDVQQSEWEAAGPGLQPASPFEVLSARIPGYFPESPPSERPAKRKRDLGGAWVMVPSPDTREATGTTDPSTRSGPARPPSRTGSRRSVPPTMVARRHSSNATHAGSPVTQSGAHAASTALQRSPSTLLPPRSSSPSAKLDPRRPSSRRQSAAVTAAGSTTAAAADLSPDAQRYQARVKRQEREQDASMRKMNAKLQEMIEQGRAALGASFDAAAAAEDSNGWELDGGGGGGSGQQMLRGSRRPYRSSMAS